MRSKTFTNMILMLFMFIFTYASFAFCQVEDDNDELKPPWASYATNQVNKLSASPQPVSSSSGSSSKDRSLAQISGLSEVNVLKYSMSNGKCCKYDYVNICLDIINLNQDNEVTKICIEEILPEGITFVRSFPEPEYYNNTNNTVKWKLTSLDNNMERITFIVKVNATDELALNPTIMTAKSNKKHSAASAKDIFSLSNLMYISVINRPPEINKVHFPEGPIWRGDDVYISASIIDQDNDNITCSLWSSIYGYVENPIENEQLMEINSSIYQYNFCWNLANCSSGEHTFYLVAKDDKSSTVNIGQLEIRGYNSVLNYKIESEYINPILLVATLTVLFTAVYEIIKYIISNRIQVISTTKTVGSRIKLAFLRFIDFFTQIIKRVFNKIFP